MGAAPRPSRSTCMDALGSNIRVDARGAQVMRVLPRLNDDVNEEWISDKTRHAIDGLRYQRLDRPYVRKGGKLVEATWDEAFAAIAAKLGKLEGAQDRGHRRRPVRCRIDGGAEGPDGGLGSPNVDCRQDGAKLDGPRGSYIFNAGIRGIDQADAILLIGTNPRWESPVLNARIRKRYLHGRCADRQHRPGCRSHLSGRAARRRSGDPARARRRQARLRREAEGGQEPADHRRHGRARARGRRGRAGAGARARRQLAPCATTGTASPSCTPRRRASAASISAWCRARAAATWPASWPAAEQGRDRRRLPAGGRRDRHRASSARPS